MSTQHEKDIDQLNSFLRGERSAVQTYEQCIEKVDDPQVQQQLRRLASSHERRVEILSEKVRSLGGSPAADSGVWGSFAKLVQGGAKVFGKAAAISALEEGEDHGREDYQRDLKDLSPELQRLVRNDLLPEQLRTHQSLSALQESI